ncbi:YcxB family protein [Acholeplasma sp. OttesenSCG-928-E16]|nr:YcxB family protein [Acholeplasma sp. OttesenSCG-928-E16]
MITNKTIYTLKKYRQLNKKETLYGTLLIWGGTILVSVLLIIMPFISSVDKIFFIIFGVMVFLMVAVVRIIKYVSFGKNINQDIEREYFFNEEGFSVTSSTKGNKSTTNYDYDKIVNIKKDQNNIYLFITKKSAFIIDNQGFTNGNKEELLALLSSKVEIKKK